ncbi:MAG: sigma-54-dependent Fis family transcriptional regulator [Gammaproteobacteria bacterium]|nr:MAG: sigma-54-dependent Fis family transcriptional regulator [Gammaproteobacteria bacterium]
MAKKKHVVLMVEDSPSQAEAYKVYLAKESLNVVHVTTGEDALKQLDVIVPDVILLDLQLPGMHGMDVLQHVVSHEMPSPVVVITDDGSVDVAVEAMRSGAFDFVTKPFGASRLKVTVRNAIRQEELADLVEAYREQFDRDRFHGFLGQSLKMQAVYRIIESAAPSKASVFVTGESGTGKELCAEAIHQESPRKNEPFVPVNCAAIPRELMESEIFGHVKGAFTGAVRARDGAATQADGGTLFLDEVCEMDLDLQSKLLRFIQTGSFQKVGASEQTQVDVRFVCATNRNPMEEIKKGNFREDLYYRLHVIPIPLPPLREREDDVLLMARRFLEDYASEEGKDFKGFSREAEAIIVDYAWPGNVRELQNVIRQVVVLNPGGVVTRGALPLPLRDTETAVQLGIAATDSSQAEPQAADQAGDAGIRPLWMVEKDTIENAITACDGNVPKAAALLEISASTIYRKRQTWETADE